MAGLTAILKALARVERRDQKTFQSVVGNNFFFVTILLIGPAGGFIYLIIGLVLLFPLSTDPLRKIPASRLQSWPLEQRQRRLLRALSPWVNPVTWLLAALALWSARGHLSIGLWALATALVAAAFLLSDLPLARLGIAWKAIPEFPSPLNQLVRKNLREQFATLDFYCAALLSLATLAYRFFARPLPPEAFLAITVLAMLALSSYAQCLFGLDGAGGLSRYHLLPLRGWQIIAAKDAAFLLIAVPIVLPLAPLAGIGAASIALAIGHEPSVSRFRPQTRWRFSTGASVVLGLLQAAAMTAAASGIYFNGAWVLLPCLAAWLLSLWGCGRLIDRRSPFSSVTDAGFPS